MRMYFQLATALLALVLSIGAHSQQAQQPEVVRPSGVFHPPHVRSFAVEAHLEDVWKPFIAFVHEQGLELRELSTKLAKLEIAGEFSSVSDNSIVLNAKNMTASPFANQWGECVIPTDSRSISETVTLWIDFDEWTHNQRTRVRTEIKSRLIRTIEVGESIVKVECISSGNLERSIFEYITSKHPLFE